MDQTTNDLLKITQRIMDINNDGKNEVILSDEKLFKGENIGDRNRVACFNSSGKLIWQYKFEDTVSTNKDKHSNIYTNYLIDTTTENGLKVLYLFTRNDILYPSSIYRLNLETGKRLPGTLWHAGQIAQCILGKFNNNNKEIVGIAINNSFERSVVFSINLKNLNGQAPSTKEYRYVGIPEAKFNNYVLLPKTDYTIYRDARYNRAWPGSLIYNKTQGFFSFTLLEGGYGELNAGICFHFHKNLSLLGIYVGDEFQVKRDLLVKQNKLNPPYTNTNASQQVSLTATWFKNYELSEIKDGLTVNH